MGFEPDRDRFFQYATFVTLGLTVLVCACYALLFFNPRANLIAALRPETATPDLSIAELPATWTPTFTATATSTPPFTATFTPTSTSTPTPVDTFTPTFIPTPTIFYIVVTGIPTRRPPTRPPATVAPAPLPTQPPPPPVPQFEFRVGGPGVVTSRNCGSWQVGGTVYNNASGAQRLNGLLVRVWAYGAVQGTDRTGSHAQGAGYWEWNFGAGSNVQGEVAIVNSDGSQRSPRIPFTLNADCNSDGSAQHATIDFVGNQ